MIAIFSLQSMDPIDFLVKRNYLFLPLSIASYTAMFYENENIYRFFVY